MQGVSPYSVGTVPIYEYHCAVCRRAVEIFQRRARSEGAAPPVCPECGAAELRPRFSRFSSRTELSFPGFDTMDDVDESDPESVAAWRKSAGAPDELPADL